MIRFFYNLFIYVLGLVFRVASFFNQKADKWVKGRANWRKNIKESIKELNRADADLVWLHAASLGEFEQGKPILDRLKQDYPNLKIVLSFFSPSGYEVAKNYSGADLICYLPLDTPTNAETFVELVKPTLVLWMKYEYWWNHLHAISRRKIPVILVSAIFQKRQPFFKWYGNGYREMLHCFTHLFVQTDESRSLIQPLLGLEKITVSGDTRFDRVTSLAQNWEPIPEIDQWLGIGSKVVVAGSTWPDDEKILWHLITTNKEIKWIIAPHHVDRRSLKETFARFPKHLLFSQLSDPTYLNNYPESNLLIIDCIGLLKRIYHYATICYIGGGFSATGIHNVLEAAVFGKPLIFGPEYEEYAEAIGLVSAGGAFPVENALELENRIQQLFKNEEMYHSGAKASAHFVSQNKGATTTIVDFIYKNRLLTRL